MAFKIIDQRIMMAAIGGAAIIFALASPNLEIIIRAIMGLVGAGLIYKSRFF